MSFREDSALKFYKQIIYRRIQLAAAVFVVRSTPKGKSPEIHAADIQQKLRTLWLSSSLLPDASNTSVCTEQHILTRQQDALSSKLISLIPSNLEGKDYPTHSENSDDIHQRQSSETSAVRLKQYHDILTVKENMLKTNANFVQAVTQLKAIAEFQVAIPSEYYVQSISKLCGWKTAISSTMNEFQPQSRFSLSWNDSDFHADNNYNIPGITHSGGNAQVRSIASSVLLYIVNSCNANGLLKKTVWGILNQLKSVACDYTSECSVLSLVETINQWTGSVYQQALFDLRSAIDSQLVHFDNSIHDLSLSFIQEIILQVKKNTENRKMYYLMKEYQMAMVLVISEGTNLWFNSLEYIWTFLSDCTNSITSKHAYLCQTEPNLTNYHPRKDFLINCYDYLQEVEESIFLLVLGRIFLTLAKQNTKFEKSEDRYFQSHLNQFSEHNKNTIIGLWRKHHQVEATSSLQQMGTADTVSQTRRHLQQWKQLLDESFGRIKFEYPLLAIVVCECTHFLPSYQQEI